MRNLISKIIVPFFQRKIKSFDLPSNQQAVLLLDCWKVHKSKEFLGWLKSQYPWIIVLFIPAGCTGKVQVCDLVAQKSIKTGMRNECNAYLASQVAEQLKKGILPDSLLAVPQILPCR
eukprot:Pompholyxophrys_sp_v1_NODE_339_length_719_cov_43.186747.p1 type:complete len:118 gc:universal NODE_339_length_719_cov_43.186747:278-631(+)